MVVFHVCQIVQKAPNHAKHHILRLGGKALHQFTASLLNKVTTQKPRPQQKYAPFPKTGAPQSLSNVATFYQTYISTK